MPTLSVTSFGTKGVNVDANPLELDDSELVQAQNCVSDATTGTSSIRKRPGLIEFTVTDTADTVLGGCDIPLQDLSALGTRFIYIGRGPQ